jgi:outer membrane immunogenic protein
MYVSGGGAVQRIKLQASCLAFGGAADFCSFNEDTPRASKTMTEWTVGAGVEYRVAGNWFARLDYQCADFGTFSNTFFTVVTAEGVATIASRQMRKCRLRRSTPSIAYRL